MTSHFATVAGVLGLIRCDLNLREEPGQVAAKLFPPSCPEARKFFAWERYYGNPNAKRDTLKAMDRQ